MIVVVIIAILGVLATGVFSNNHHSAEINNSENVFWASSETTKFHKPTCEWAYKIKESNKIVYNSREAAIEDGKIPCEVCNP